MKKSAFILLSVLICFSCNDSSDGDEELCTLHFELIPLAIQYDDGTPVGIDRYKVMWGDREITPVYTPDEYLMARKYGKYAILSDFYQKELEGLTEKITVTGFIGAGEVFKEDYLVGADKCHVLCYETEPLVVTVERRDDSYYPCTSVLKSIILKVVYKDDSPVMLDSHRVMWGDREITPVYLPNEYQMARKSGKYAILNDLYQKEMEGLTEKITVTGYIGKKEVFKEDYLVGADDCHVTYIGTKPLSVTLKK